MIYRYKKKIAEVVQARKEMEQKRYSVARFYEEVLEIPDEQILKLPARAQFRSNPSHRARI